MTQINYSSLPDDFKFDSFGRKAIRVGCIALACLAVLVLASMLGGYLNIQWLAMGAAKVFTYSLIFGVFLSVILLPILYFAYSFTRRQQFIVNGYHHLEQFCLDNGWYFHVPSDINFVENNEYLPPNYKSARYTQYAADTVWVMKGSAGGATFELASLQYKRGGLIGRPNLGFMSVFKVEKLPGLVIKKTKNISCVSDDRFYYLTVPHSLYRRREAEALLGAVKIEEGIHS